MQYTCIAAFYRVYHVHHNRSLYCIKLRFSGLIRKFKKNESLKKLYRLNAVHPRDFESSKEFLKCRILNLMIMECFRYLVFICML